MKKVNILCVVATAICAAVLPAFAGANLIQNGTFEGTGTQATWGAYATSANVSAGKFRCDNWTFYNSSDGGVTKLDSDRRPWCGWQRLDVLDFGSGRPIRTFHTGVE